MSNHSIPKHMPLLHQKLIFPSYSVFTEPIFITVSPISQPVSITISVSASVSVSVSVFVSVSVSVSFSVCLCMCMSPSLSLYASVPGSVSVSVSVSARAGRDRLCYKLAFRAHPRLRPAQPPPRLPNADSRDSPCAHGQWPIEDAWHGSWKSREAANHSTAPKHQQTVGAYDTSTHAHRNTS